MVAGYAEESLQLAATEAVYAHNNLSLTQLNQQLFGNDANKIPSTLQSFIRRHFITQLKALIRHLGKKRIYNEIKNGSSKFIKKFSENYKAKKLDCLFANCPDISLRLKQLINEKSEGSILTEFGRYFERIRNKFAPLKAEEIFRMNLFEWFSSGEMTWDIFMCVKTWHKNGAKLRELKKLKLPPATGRDLYYKKVIVSCNAIGTDTFMEPQKVENILCKFLDEPKIEKKLEKIVISGRLIYLKQISAKIQEVVTSEIKQIEIYASHCCHIDVDLLLYENNLSISSKKVYIWNKQVINLSGKTYRWVHVLEKAFTGNSKAANAKNNSECGQDGTDGLPGFSAGNLLILTKEMVNPENLTVYQKGGRGQDGNDGGDGYNGPNGVGVTKNELEQLCVNYGSLYFGLWNTFYNYAPPRNWTRTKSEWSYGSQYGYEQYKDENGRIMTYSYAGFKNHWYEAMTYDLYFFIQGTCGKHGTKGGGNGIGGEGGYRGNARIENPETGEKFPVNTIREAGQNGANGKCGKSGTMGKNGNDMALIDRSVSGGSKFIYGSNETAELTMSYEYSDSTYNRCDGYRKHYEGKSACFASFAASDIDTTIKQAQAPVERTVRTNRSKAVAKQSIIAEEIMSNADELFANEEMFLSDACKEVSLTNAEAEEEEEAEEQETVAEQVVILKERDDNEKIVRYTPGAEKKLRPKFTAISLVERIKASGRHASHGTCAQNIFDLFAIEISFKQLETIKFHTLFQKNHLYHAVTESKLALAVIAACQNRLVSGKSYTEIINFVKDVTYRRQQKYLFTQFRNSLDEFIIDLESSDVTINPTINTEDNQIYGIKKCALKLEANDEIIDKFFASFTEHSVDLPIMKLFNIFQKQIKEHDNFRNLLVELSQNVNWLNGEIVEKHMKELTGE
uniref:Uncharacterized protein n=1 Tax=Panagrolaimus sp. ES5 TaxID=591445 RepID=A0AC34F083_9BILA